MKTSIFRISTLALAMGLVATTAALADTTPAATGAVDDTAMSQNQNRGQTQAPMGQDGRAMQQHRKQMQRRMGPAGAHPELVSEQERIEFRQKMRAAQSIEERQALRQEMRNKVQERAKAAGIELPERGAMRDGRPDHAGMGMRGQRPDHMGMRGQRPDGAMMGERGPRH